MLQVVKQQHLNDIFIVAPNASVMTHGLHKDPTLVSRRSEDLHHRLNVVPSMRPTVHALVFSFFAGVSLPLGALFGHILGSKVSDAICASFMALGAGSLLFAVTVEIYGHVLTEMHDGSAAPLEVAMTTVGGLLGAALFMKVNKWLEKFLIDSDKSVKAQESADQTGFRTSALASDPCGDADDRAVALSLYAGLVIDGLPEGVLMGFLAAEGHFSLVFAVSVFISQFPEAFVAASLFRKAGMKSSTMLAMWGGLCLVSVILAGLSCAMLLRVYPGYAHGEELPTRPAIAVALTEGVTGGAMLACISSTMLPEALERTGKDTHVFLSSGFLCASGFLLAVVLKAVGG